MPWVRIDTSYVRHPKRLALTPRQREIHLAAMCWAGEQYTGGRIPASVLPMLGAKRSDAARLVDVGLWEEAPGDAWAIHDWEVYNDDAERAKETRDASAERRRRWREEKRRQRKEDGQRADMSTGQQPDNPADQLPDMSSGQSPAARGSRARRRRTTQAGAARNHDPSRPVPSPVPPDGGDGTGVGVGAAPPASALEGAAAEPPSAPAAGNGEPRPMAADELKAVVDSLPDGPAKEGMHRAWAAAHQREHAERRAEEGGDDG